MEIFGHHLGLIVRTGGVSLLLIFAFLWLGSPLRANDTRRVVMLHAFNFSNPGIAATSQAARKRLLERLPQGLVIDADFLDLGRVSDPGHELRTANFLREKYAHTPPDVVMTLDSEALPFIVKHRDAIAPKIPVVFTGVSRANYAASRPPPDVTGIIVELDLEKTLTLAERLQPDARRLVVIAGSSALDRRWQATARGVIEGRARKFETTYLFDLPYAALVAELSHVPRDAIVIILTFFVDGAGQRFISSSVRAELAARSPAPAYSPYDIALGLGIVGGFGETLESMGIAGADIVLEILAGKDPATIPPRANLEQAYRVNYKAMQRWSLRESNLPAGTIVLFKEPTVWDQYRWQIMVIAATLLLQTALITGLIYQRRHRRIAEAAARGSMRKLAHMNRIATAGELSASIAHEVNQPLAAIVANANAGLRFLANAEPDLNELRATLKSVVSDGHRAGDVVASVRGMFKEASEEKTPLDVNDLIQGVLGLVRGELHAQEIIAQTRLGSRLPLVLGNRGQLQQVVLNLFRNAADAMSSVSGRTRVLTVTSAIHDPDGVLVSVEDSGAGIDPKTIERIFEPFYTTKSQGMGMGLSICRSIIEAHRGRLWASPGINHGAIFSVLLPAVNSGAEQ